MGIFGQRGAGMLVPLAMIAFPAQAEEFNSTLSDQQYDKMFNEACQSEEATLAREFVAKGKTYNREAEFPRDEIKKSIGQTDLEQQWAELRAYIDDPKYAYIHNGYLLMSCMIEYKYEVGMERAGAYDQTAPAQEPPAEEPPAFNPPPFDVDRVGQADSDPFVPVPPSYQNGPLDESKFRDGSEPQVEGQLQAPIVGTYGNGPLVEEPEPKAKTVLRPPAKPTTPEGEAATAGGTRCLVARLTNSVTLSNGTRYDFEFENICDDEISVDLTYASNPKSYRPYTYVRVYGHKTMPWSCTDLDIGASDCTNGDVESHARWP